MWSWVSERHIRRHRCTRVDDDTAARETWHQNQSYMHGFYAFDKFAACAFDNITLSSCNQSAGMLFVLHPSQTRSSGYMAFMCITSAALHTLRVRSP